VPVGCPGDAGRRVPELGLDRLMLAPWAISSDAQVCRRSYSPMFRVVVSGRRDQEPSFFTVIVWRDQAEHVVESLSKGSRVVGRLQQSCR